MKRMLERKPIKVSSPKSPHYNRLKYFSSLQKLQVHEAGDLNSAFLEMPEHLLHAEYFILHY